MHRLHHHCVARGTRGAGNAAALAAATAVTATALAVLARAHASNQHLCVILAVQTLA